MVCGSTPQQGRLLARACERKIEDVGASDRSFERVRSYYASFDEWARLDSLGGKLEVQRTVEIISPHLEAKSRVLDLGGGPGRYTIELARRGHVVDLVDLSPQLVQVARTKIEEAKLSGRVRSVQVGNAIELCAFATDEFDAVVALGPLYHLVAEEDRRAMATETVRVLRPGGMAFVAFIPRLSNTAWLIERALTSPERVPAEVLRAVHERGVLCNPTNLGFQEGYYATAAEVTALFAGAGMTVERVESIRGLAYGREALFDDLPEGVAETAREIVRQTATDTAVVEMSGHALYVGRKVG